MTPLGDLEPSPDMIGLEVGTKGRSKSKMSPMFLL